MLKIGLTNYPPGSTSSSIELAPEAELPGLAEHVWVSERPLPEVHVFNIDKSFYPLRITLFIVQAGYELVYTFQGTHPEEPDYMLVNLPQSATYSFDVGNEILYMESRVNWAPVVISAAICIVATGLTIHGTRRKKQDG